MDDIFNVIEVKGLELQRNRTVKAETTIPLAALFSNNIQKDEVQTMYMK